MSSFTATLVKRFLFNRDEGAAWPQNRVYHHKVVLVDENGLNVPEDQWDAVIGKEAADHLRSEDEYEASLGADGEGES